MECFVSWHLLARSRPLGRAEGLGGFAMRPVPSEGSFGAHRGAVGMGHGSEEP